MQLDKDTVARIARLARIHVPNSQQEALAAELTQIMDWVEQLEEVNTENVEPLRSVMGLKREWRQDIVDDGNKREEVLSNAPATFEDCFVVPKVIE